MLTGPAGSYGLTHPPMLAATRLPRPAADLIQTVTADLDEIDIVIRPLFPVTGPAGLLTDGILVERVNESVVGLHAAVEASGQPPYLGPLERLHSRETALAQNAVDALRAHAG